MNTEIFRTVKIGKTKLVAGIENKKSIFFRLADNGLGGEEMDENNCHLWKDPYGETGEGVLKTLNEVKKIITDIAQKENLKTLHFETDERRVRVFMRYLSRNNINFKLIKVDDADYSHVEIAI